MESILAEWEPDIITIEDPDYNEEDEEYEDDEDDDEEEEEVRVHFI